MRGLALLGVVVSGCAAPPPPVPVDARPNLLLVTLDTTRADALGAWGGRPTPSPRIDALAATGLRVEEAMSVTPLTLPSHTSMLSGIYPDRHGVRSNGSQLPEELRLVSQDLAASGYTTGASVGAVVLDGGLGLERGFSWYHDAFDLTRLEGLHDEGATRRAREVADEALGWLAQVPEEEPVFLWVHFYDPHHPLLPRADRLERLGDPYLAEIAAADEEAGRVLDAVKAHGARPWVAVVVGDHGEGRGDHGETTHGQLVYRSTMAVPLLVAGSDVPTSTRPGPASVVDVGPTLLDAAGLPAPDDLDGVSLLDAPVPDRVVYGETWHSRNALGMAWLRVWQDHTHRFVRAPRDEVYAWTTDPGELQDLALSQPDLALRWRERSDAWLAARPPTMGAMPGELDPATREALERLGYLQGSPREDADPDSLPDPKDHPDLLSEVDRVVTESRRRPPAEAVPVLEAFSEKHPGVRVSRVLLARALALSDRPREALEVDRGLLEETPDEPTLLGHAAEQHMTLGELPDAAALLERALVQLPGDPVLTTLRAEVHRRAGSCQEGVALLGPVLEAHPESTRGRLVYGACLREIGRLAEAEAELARVLTEDPENVDVRYVLGVTRLALGKVAAATPILEEQVERSPDSVLARTALGVARLTTGDAEGAIEALEPAAAHPDSGVDGPVALAEALLANGASDEAIERWLDEAEARAPGHPRVLATRASVRLRAGDAPAAMELMRRSREAAERRDPTGAPGRDAPGVRP